MLSGRKTLGTLCAAVSALMLWVSLPSVAYAAPNGPAKVKKADVKKHTTKRTVVSTRKSHRVTVARKKGSPHARRVKVVQTVTGVRTVKHAPSVQRSLSAPAASVGQRLGLHASDDALDLNSSVALVVDQQTNEVLFSKNDEAVLPIASLTKLMTGLVVVDAGLDMDEVIAITADDIDTMKGSRSRLAVGTRLTRGELMHLALMSSENRAAHALGRSFPGGLREFVRRMNGKAEELGMHDTRYVEPTGLSSENRSSARDLATLVAAAYERPVLRDLSTSPAAAVDVGRRTLQFNNSNRLVKSPNWDIGLQKTGYISEAGRCLVMQARVAGRELIMVFLDASGKVGRLRDAERVRRWVETRVDGGSDRPRPQG